MENVNPDTFDCAQPGCSIRTNGKCVNGLNPVDCPDKISIVKTVSADEEEVREVDAEKIPDTIRLQWGENFQEDTLSMITYRYPCKLVLLIGEPSCGKSTLYGALFDSFHKGGCGSYIFSSTRTPIGFERICHLARETSKGRTPDTERTKSYEFTYFHIAVRKRDLSGPVQHLVFADVNGELFQAARDSDEAMSKLSVINRATRIFFIADGNRLINNSEKHAVKDDITKMIERCSQNKMFNPMQEVHLIITKWDEVVNSNKAKDVNDFFIQPIVARFNTILLSVIKVASRSMYDQTPSRLGLDEFLNSCLENTKKPKAEIYTPEIKREIQKFKYERNQ